MAAVSIIGPGPWQATGLGPVRVTAAPASHGVPEVTYILQADGTTVFFGADTRRIPELNEIAQRFPAVDLAPDTEVRILPTGQALKL